MNRLQVQNPDGHLTAVDWLRHDGRIYVTVHGDGGGTVAVDRHGVLFQSGRWSTSALAVLSDVLDASPVADAAGWWNNVRVLDGGAL